MNPSHRGRQPIFQNYRSIILLLKKSLQSVGIDKKKDIFDILDTIQKESEKNDEKVLKKEFQKLTHATVMLMHTMGYHGSIFACEYTMYSLKDDCLESANQGKDPVVELDKVDITLKILNDVIVEQSIHQLRVSIETKLAERAKSEDLTQTVYCGELLGENSALIVREFRPLYFGLKNIALKEIESIDREIDIQQFFFDQVEFDNPPQLGQSQTSSILQHPLAGIQ